MVRTKNRTKQQLFPPEFLIFCPKFFFGQRRRNNKSNVTGKTEKTTQNGKLKKKDVGCDEKNHIHAYEKYHLSTMSRSPSRRSQQPIINDEEVVSAAVAEEEKNNNSIRRRSVVPFPEQMTPLKAENNHVSISKIVM